MQKKRNKSSKLKASKALRMLAKEITRNPEILNTIDDNKLPEFVKALKYYLRSKCRKDLFFLCKYIFGFKEMTMRFHGDLCKTIQEVNKFVVNRHKMKVIPILDRSRLFMLFRGCFKTTIISIAHSIQLLLLDPDLRICLASNKLDNSKSMLLSIKSQFMYNVLFRFLFPEFCPMPNKEGKIEWGTSTAITVPNRKDLTIREGSIECAGVDTGLISRHYDYMKKDDLVTDKSVTTLEQINASIDWDRLSISLFNIPEKGFTDWIGTRYNEMDLYGHLLKRPNDKLLKVLRSAVDAAGYPAFPERFSKEGLDDIREIQGEYIYSCQYLLDPIPAKDRRFLSKWFETWAKLPELYGVCILVDPASSRKKSAKFTAIVVHAIARVNGVIKWFLIDGVFDKLNGTQRVEALFKLVRKYKHVLRIVSYETIGFQDTDRENIRRKMDEEDFHFSISQISAQENSKVGRIEGMVPFYEYGKVYFPKKLPYFSKYYGKKIDIVQVIKYELLKFTPTHLPEHTDFIDAQSQQLRYNFVAPTRAIQKPKLVPGSFMYLRAKLKKYRENPLSEHISLEDAWEKIKV